MYADSEDVKGANRSADKTFDLQESTYWGTRRGDKYPHYIVVDLGDTHNLGALQYLPRMEKGAPGAIKDVNIYVSETPFRY